MSAPLDSRRRRSKALRQAQMLSTLRSLLVFSLSVWPVVVYFFVTRVRVHFRLFEALRRSCKEVRDRACASFRAGGLLPTERSQMHFELHILTRLTVCALQEAVLNKLSTIIFARVWAV